jgi:hypothetical protein
MGSSLHSTSERSGISACGSVSSGADCEIGHGADRNYIRAPIAGLEGQRHTGMRRAVARKAQKPSTLREHSYHQEVLT